MRRLARLPSSPSVLPTSSTTTGARTAAASLLKCELIKTQNLSSARPNRQTWQNGIQSQRRCLSSTSQLAATEKTTPGSDAEAAAVVADEVVEYEEEEFVQRRRAKKSKRAPIQTDLVFPDAIKGTAAPGEVTDPDYVPAESGLGLEEVGGLEGWWDNPQHWGPSKKYVGYGPREKITEPEMLEVLTRRALTEAIAASFFSQQEKRPGHRSGKLPALSTIEPLKGDTIKTTDKTKLELKADGTPRLATVGDYFRILQVLRRPPPRDEATSLPVPPTPGITIWKARALLKKWQNSDWKSASLADPALKFHVAKRLYYLTGHMVPDAKLLIVKTAGDLVAQVVTPPQPKKLIEVLEASELPTLPNVQMFPRRVTPVDKEKMVGRWKIITKELQQRDLPIIGTGGYGKAVEKKWAAGN
ncbi:ribosomal subunit 39S-domain-containing protein [Podospora didyma]|uniref:Large ribosomal subunit protein mL50 n=1 Tax=Podospora didyma TaxID=330526 RepID=A0AAE0NI47_9PEZI|nr:ribosomal subunit 39S-domain-containing protein [Podospora didyma]